MMKNKSLIHKLLRIDGIMQTACKRNITENTKALRIWNKATCKQCIQQNPYVRYQAGKSNFERKVGDEI